jgi:uncharacterized protein YfiM (DUF2279 family)
LKVLNFDYLKTNNRIQRIFAVMRLKQGHGWINRCLVCFVILFYTPEDLKAQETFVSNSAESILNKTLFKDSLYRIYPYNKKRVQLVAAANIVGYSGIMVGLNATWYAKYPRSRFHFFDDNAEWLQVDKVGHIYGSYIESRSSNELWRWTGLPRKKRIWISGLSGIAYETIIETLDGFSSEYGWSWGDFSSNVIGSGIFIAQELAWDDQRIKFKFSFHKNNYGQADLNARANSIFGKTEAERFIKDYNAITDWVSVDIQPFFPGSKLPKWFAIAMGYGAEGMFGARSNVARDFNRSDIKRYRQWYLAPDIDLTRIRTNKKGVKFILTVLSAFKFPAPSLEFSNGSFKGHWLHF